MTALEEFPAELEMEPLSGGARWMLVITGPDLRGTAVSTSQDMVLAIAEAYAAMRRSQVVTL